MEKINKPINLRKENRNYNEELEDVKEVTRFDLEEQILQCWNITDDLNLVHGLEYREDIIAMVDSLKTIYEAKFDKCFRTFEELIKVQKL